MITYSFQSLKKQHIFNIPDIYFYFQSCELDNVRSRWVKHFLSIDFIESNKTILHYKVCQFCKYHIIQSITDNRAKMEWKQVLYSKSNINFPSERWGHRMVCTKSNELVFFGGFGGSALQGRYLNDVWSYSINDCTWQQIGTSGALPQNRSNYTLHYDHITNNIILFGGSSEQRVRTNHLSLLNWTRKEWREVAPPQNSESPCQRTYHSGEYHHPYLIVHGGEGVFGQDLDDTWIFDTHLVKWRKLLFDEESVPQKRRFHSTALWDHYFYVIGGCNESYVLLGDMYRVNLQALFKQREHSGFKWECLFRNREVLSRWGHCSLVYQNKIYIFGGKINANSDNDSGASFDCLTLELSYLNISGSAALPPRRRQAASIVGNSLIIFGGFNGKYMNDFYYLVLGDSVSSNYHCRVVADRNLLMQQLQKSQLKMEGDVTFKLFRKNKVQFLLKSHREQLRRYQFFANLFTFSPKSTISLQLPPFCDVTAFRIVHLCLLEKEILICSKFSVQYWISIALTFEYLVCLRELHAFSRQMCRIVNECNCLQLLQIGTELGLQNLRRSAGEVYFLHHEHPPRKHRYSESTNQSNLHSHPVTMEQLGKTERESPSQILALQEVYETIRFDVAQKRLKIKGSILSRFRSVFKKQNPQAISVISENQQDYSFRGRENNQQSQPGCFRRFLAFMGRICESSENDDLSP